MTRDTNVSYTSAMEELFSRRSAIMEAHTSQASDAQGVNVILEPQTRRQLRRLELEKHLHNTKAIESLGRESASKPKAPIDSLMPAAAKPVAGGTRTRLRKSAGSGATKLDEELQLGKAAIEAADEHDRRSAQEATEMIDKEKSAAIKLQSIHRGRVARAAVSEDYYQWTSPIGGGSDEPMDTRIAIGVAKCSRLQSEWMADESNEVALNAYLAALVELESIAEEEVEVDNDPHGAHMMRGDGRGSVTLGETAHSSQTFTFGEIAQMEMAKAVARNIANRQHFDEMLRLGGVDASAISGSGLANSTDAGFYDSTSKRATTAAAATAAAAPPKVKSSSPFGNDEELYLRNAAGAIGNDASVFGSIGQIGQLGGKAVDTAQRTVGATIKLPFKVAGRLLCLNREPV